jgi:hypothetical protein
LSASVKRRSQHSITVHLFHDRLNEKVLRTVEGKKLWSKQVVSASEIIRDIDREEAIVLDQLIGAPLAVNLRQHKKR